MLWVMTARQMFSFTFLQPLNIIYSAFKFRANLLEVLNNIILVLISQ